MSEQGQTSIDREIQALETMVQQLEAEMRNVEATIQCATLKGITMRFLQILKDRAETKIRLLRERQN